MLVIVLGIIVREIPVTNLLVAVSMIAKQLSLQSYAGLPLSTVMSDNQLHPAKGLSTMLVTELGMLIALIAVPANATSPMLVTVLGMTVLRQPEINVLVAVSMIALQLSLLSYTGLPLSTVMFRRNEQELKTPVPMLVTELGMVMVSMPIWLKALFPMLVKEFGRTMCRNIQQLLKASAPMLVIVFGKVTLTNEVQFRKALGPMPTTV